MFGRLGLYRGRLAVSGCQALVEAEVTACRSLRMNAPGLHSALSGGDLEIRCSGPLTISISG